MNRFLPWQNPLCVFAKSLQSYLTLCDPMDCSSPGSSVHGILQPRILEWGCHFLFQGILLTQGLNPCLLCLPHWQASSLYHQSHLGSLAESPGGIRFMISKKNQYMCI